MLIEKILALAARPVSKARHTHCIYSEEKNEEEREILHFLVTLQVPNRKGGWSEAQLGCAFP